MKSNPIKEGVIASHSRGMGTPTAEQVKKRAVEIAIINGRSALQVFPSDWDQAKRELTGGGSEDPKTATLEAAPESERWAPAAATSGRKVPAYTGDDDDADGRSDSERLTQEGLDEAEHETMLRAARENP
jgi:hypothetical protein